MGFIMVSEEMYLASSLHRNSDFQSWQEYPTEQNHGLSDTQGFGVARYLGKQCIFLMFNSQACLGLSVLSTKIWKSFQILLPALPPDNVFVFSLTYTIISYIQSTGAVRIILMFNPFNDALPLTVLSFLVSLSPLHMACQHLPHAAPAQQHYALGSVRPPEKSSIS